MSRHLCPTPSPPLLETLDCSDEISAELLAISTAFWSICSSRVFTSFTQSAERVSPSCAVSSSEVMTVWASTIHPSAPSAMEACRAVIRRVWSIFFVSVRGGGGNSWGGV